MPRRSSMNRGSFTFGNGFGNGAPGGATQDATRAGSPLTSDGANAKNTSALAGISPAQVCASDIVKLGTEPSSFGPNPSPTYNVHEELLCAQSPYFNNLLRGPFEEGVTKKRDITLENTSNATLSHFVTWLYLGKLPLGTFSTSILVKIIIFGDKFDTPGLRYTATKDFHSLNSMITFCPVVQDVKTILESLPDTSPATKITLDVMARRHKTIFSDYDSKAKAPTDNSMFGALRVQWKDLPGSFFTEILSRVAKLPFADQPLPEFSAYWKDEPTEGPGPSVPPSNLSSSKPGATTSSLFGSKPGAPTAINSPAFSSAPSASVPTSTSPFGGLSGGSPQTRPSGLFAASTSPAPQNRPTLSTSIFGGTNNGQS